MVLFMEEHKLIQKAQITMHTHIQACTPFSYSPSEELNE